MHVLESKRSNGRGFVRNGVARIVVKSEVDHDFVSSRRNRRKLLFSRLTGRCNVWRRLTILMYVADVGHVGHDV